MEIPDDMLRDYLFVFKFETYGGNALYYNLRWTCVDADQEPGDFVGQTGTISGISGSSGFAAMMCNWECDDPDDY